MIKNLVSFLEELKDKNVTVDFAGVFNTTKYFEDLKSVEYDEQKQTIVLEDAYDEIFIICINHLSKIEVFEGLSATLSYNNLVVTVTES